MVDSEGRDTLTTRFERNIAAITGLQPELARRLRDLPVPETVEPAVGRDGCSTFRLVGPDGRRRWLGGSSMPSISSSALVERFEPGGANVLVPTAGTGRELDLLCRATPPHTAVFAYESDPLNLKLVLHALDLARWLSAGRLILLAFEPLEAALAAFLARHPGYDPPAKMLACTGLPPDALDEARLGSEKAMSAAAARQWDSARELAAALRTREWQPIGERPRVAIFSADARPRYMAAAHGLAAALKERGWPGVTLIPDSPWSCHTLTRLATIHEHRPDFVLLLNSCAGRLGEFLPEALPIVSWFWPGAEINSTSLEGLSPQHWLLAATPEQRDQLIAAGANPAKTRLLAPGVDTSVYRPVELRAERREAVACDAAIVADAVECSPGALGITLESHVRLWETLRERLVSGAESYRPSKASRLVEEAERLSGVELESGELRDRLIRLVQGPLARTEVTAATVAHLRSFGFVVTVWGRGWEGRPEVAESLAGPIPAPDELNEVYQIASAVVLPCSDAWTPLLGLEILAAGGTPIIPTTVPSDGTIDFELAGVLGSIPQYDRFKALVALLRRAVLPDKTSRGVGVEHGAAVQKHDLGVRLETIRGILSGGPTR